MTSSDPTASCRSCGHPLSRHASNGCADCLLEESSGDRTLAHVCGRPDAVPLAVPDGPTRRAYRELVQANRTVAQSASGRAALRVVAAFLGSAMAWSFLLGIVLGLDPDMNSPASWVALAVAGAAALAVSLGTLMWAVRANRP